MKWVTTTIARIKRYLAYLWDGIKVRFKSFNEIGLFGLIKGLFQNFFESWSLVRIDIRDGYLA